MLRLVRSVGAELAGKLASPRDRVDDGQMADAGPHEQLADEQADDTLAEDDHALAQPRRGVEDDVRGSFDVGQECAQARVQTVGQADWHRGGHDVLGLVRVENEHVVSDREVFNLRAHLDDTADAGIAVLDRKREGALQRRQVELQSVGDLAAEDQHLGAMADGRGYRLDTNV